MNKKIKLLLLICCGMLAWHFADIKLEQPAKGLPMQITLQQSISAQAADVSYVTKVLRRDPTATSNNFLTKLYDFSKGLLNLSLFLFLVYVAFRNILNLDVETYSIKKILPKLIFAAFFGNLLLPILSIASGLIDQLQISVPFFDYPGSWSWWTMVHGGGLAMVQATSVIIGFLVPGLSAFMFLLPIIIELFLIVGLLLLGLFDSLRGYIIFLAAGLGPIAIGLSILPETESFYKKWGKIIFFWLIYPLIIGAIYYLAKNIPKMSGIRGDGLLASTIGLFIPMIVKIGLFSVAFRAPFTWEKDVSGLVAALPGQAKGGFEKGKGFLDTYGKKGVRMAWDAQTLMQRGTNQRVNSRKDEIARAGTEHLASPAGQQAVKAQKIQKFKEEIARAPEAVRLNMFNTSDMANISDRDIERSYDEYKANPEAMRDSDQSYKRHQYAFFSEKNNEDQSRDDVITQSAERRVSRQVQKKKLEAVRTDESEKTRQSPKYKWLEFEQKYGLAATMGGLAAGYRLTQETNAKEDEKAIKRKSMAFRAASSRMARGKSEQERKKDDYSKSEKSSDLDQYKPRVTDKIIAALEKVVATSVSQEDRHIEALKWFNDTAHELMVDGANIVGWDVAFEPIREELGKDFEEMMNSVSELYPRLAVLTARESRSLRDPEEQRERATTELMKFLSGGEMERENDIGAPPSNRAGGASGGTGGVGTTAQDSLDNISANLGDVTRELRDVDQSVLGVRSQIKTTTGAPLQRIATLTGRMNINQLSGDDIAELGFQTEAGLTELESSLLSKDPSKGDQIKGFIQDLDASKGLSTPEMISRAKTEFYPNEDIDPRVEEQIVNISSNQVVTMAALRDNDNNKAISTLAGEFVLNNNVSPQLVNQLDQSIQVFNQHQADPNSVSPQAIDGARQFIASNVAGLPDGSTLDRGTVDNIARVVNASVVRDPLREGPAAPNPIQRPSN